MKKEKPLILLSNDDGVEAKGLNELIRGLRGMGEIIVMAPDGPRSGASGAITSEHPVKYYKVREEEDLTVYKCTGTPVDCVKLALHTVVPRRPDVVIGGINHGDNSSVNVHYSGTMGVVIEGCLKGISSIGYSLCNHFADADFSSSLPYIRRITEQVLEHGLPLGICLNVNFPDTASLKGVRICRQTNGAWINEWKRSLHPRGGEYFWLTGEFDNYEPEAEDSDHWALGHGPLYNYSDVARASRKAGLFGHGGIGITYPSGTFNWKTGAAAVGIFTVLVICLYSFVRSRKPGD